MRKLSGGTPARKLAVGLRAVSRDQFNCGLRRRLSRPLREKNRAVVSSPHPLAKRKLPVHCAAFPRFPAPRIAHALLPANEHSMPSEKKPVNPRRFFAGATHGSE